MVYVMCEFVIRFWFLSEGFKVRMCWVLAQTVVCVYLVGDIRLISGEWNSPAIWCMFRTPKWLLVQWILLSNMVSTFGQLVCTNSSILACTGKCPPCNHSEFAAVLRRDTGILKLLIGDQYMLPGDVDGFIVYTSRNIWEQSI